MKSSEAQENKRDIQGNEARNAPDSTISTNEGVKPLRRKWWSIKNPFVNLRQSMKTKVTRVSVGVNNLNESEKAELVKWEADKYIDILKFFLDLGVKGVGLFYAITGGILTIYFGRNASTDNTILIVFLLVPANISLVLGIIYAIGAVAARKTSNKLNCISGELNLGPIPKLSFMPILIAALSLLFIGTGAALWWFYCSIGLPMPPPNNSFNPTPR